MFQPVIKWSGSKRSQASEIIKYFPKQIDTYFEPFCGGASVLRALIRSDIKVRKYVCSDLNGGLIELWNKIKFHPYEVADYYKKLWNEMEITVERKWKKAGYTIGTLSIDGKRFGDGKHYCCTLEDTDRGLDSKMPKEKILFMKKPHITAIPTGRYEVTVTYSPHFRRNLPLLNNVPGYSGIRIHPGNTAEDTDGCILVGENTTKGRVNNSKYWFALVMRQIIPALNKGEKVYITIK